MRWLVWGAIVPALLVALGAGFLARRFAPTFGLIDHPGQRKMHRAPVPLGGGVAIWLGMVAPLALGQLVLWLAIRGAIDPQSWPEFVRPHVAGLWVQSAKLWMLLAAATVLTALGLADDRRGLDWRLRIAVQTLVAGCLVFAWDGWRLTAFLDVPVATSLLSIVWIVAVVNAFNMLDNMDGLSAGVAAIASTLLATALLSPAASPTPPQLFVGGLLLVLVGALAGFLFHNLAPARLFMGDAGSYFIGLVIASATLTATFAGEGRPRHAILAPLCVLAIPLYDMASVILIRLRGGRSPFVGDTSHFSHRLVKLGLSQRQAVWTIYLATATCGLGALVLGQVTAAGAAAVLLMVFCVLAIIAVLEFAGSRKLDEP